MIQDIISHLLVAAAIAYTIISLYKTMKPKKKTLGCGSSCSSCSSKVIA